MATKNVDIKRVYDPEFAAGIAHREYLADHQYKSRSEEIYLKHT